MMSPDELKALCLSRKEAAETALRRNRETPHPNKVFNVTLEMAAKDLLSAVEVLLDLLRKNAVDEEGVKATLMERYLEFLRCRSRAQDVSEA